MRILLVTPLYPAPDDPSVASDADALRDFTRAWVRAGHEVDVVHAPLVNHAGARKLTELIPAIHYTDTLLDGARVFRAQIRCLKSNPAVRARAMFRAGREIQSKIEPFYDLCLLHCPVIARGLCEGLGVTPVPVLHSTDILALRGKRGSLADAPALGFRSERIRTDFHALQKFDGAEFVVPSGAPPAVPLRDDYRPDGALRILFVGKLIPRKQPDLLLRAAAATSRPWTLTVVGAGEMADELRSLAVGLGVSSRVTLAGALPHDETLAMMRKSDALVLPSYGETFGLVYLEAMSQGALAVGSRGEGIDGVIRDGENGFLIDARSETGLTALLTRLSDMDKNEWQTVAARARETCAAYDRDKIAASYLTNALGAAGK